MQQRANATTTSNGANKGCAGKYQRAYSVLHKLYVPTLVLSTYHAHHIHAHHVQLQVQLYFFLEVLRSV